jgi:hypothetical protein
MVTASGIWRVIKLMNLKNVTPAKAGVQSILFPGVPAPIWDSPGGRLDTGFRRYDVRDGFLTIL